MTNKALLIGTLILCCTLAFGQNNQSVIPPSPVSREFAKYITQEVALYNGTPEINIPLYTIQLKGLAIPISLSYHASGIKFGQIDGDVGVGWILNSGYRVSRTVYGYADETQSMPPDMLTTINTLEANGDIVARDGFLSKFVPWVDLDFGSSYNGFLDGEFDRFVFSTPSTSGEFIITDRANRTVSTIEESNLYIDYKVGQSLCSDLNNVSITGLKITDDVGNQYTFGEYNPQSECHIETTSPLYGGYIATGWPLSEIVTPAGEEVKFNYERRSAWDIWTTHVRNFTVRETNPLKCLIETSTPLEGDDIYFSPGYETFYSEEIITPNEKVTFQYNGDAPYAVFPKKLNQIQIEDLNGQVLKTIEFFYDENLQHIFLDHVAIYDSDHNEVETYLFDYYAQNTSATFTCDQYGYYLETSSPPRYYHQEFLDDPILVNTVVPTIIGEDCSTHTETMNSFLSGLGISREPALVPDYFSLKRITYPTSGYTEYEYEHGRFGAEGSEKNAGIRIKTVKSSDLSNSESIVRSYTYGNNYNGHVENGIGNSEILITPDLFVNEMTEVLHWCDYSEITGAPIYCDYFGQRLITYSTTIQGDIGVALSRSSFIKYPCVTEYYSKYIPANGYSLSEKSGGKTVYYFDIGNEFDVHGYTGITHVPREEYPGTHSYVDIYRPWDNPRLERQVSYSLTGGQYVAQEEIVFEYEVSSTSFTGLKVVQSAIRPNPVDSINNNNFTTDRYFDYGGYTIELGKNVLRSKTEYRYVSNNTVTTAYSYDYSNHLISKETMSRSSGGNVVTHISYPHDYATGTAFIDDMKSNNLIAYPIEQVKYLDDGTNQKILSGQITKYKIGGKGLKDEDLILETSLPISLSSFKFSDRETGVLPPLGTQATFSADDHYKSRLSYNAYDSKGNLLRVTKDGGLTTNYVWGYNRTYPIARIDNADYATIEVVLGGSTAVNTFSDMSNPTDAEVRSFLAPLFTDNRLAGAVVSIYTYKPLTGMTSQTDPGGQITYYEYDAYGRLIRIKDNNSNILKEYDYHYGEDQSN